MNVSDEINKNGMKHLIVVGGKSSFLKEVWLQPLLR